MKLLLTVLLLGVWIEVRADMTYSVWEPGRLMVRNGDTNAVRVSVTYGSAGVGYGPYPSGWVGTFPLYSGDVPASGFSVEKVGVPDSAYVRSSVDQLINYEVVVGSEIRCTELNTGSRWFWYGFFWGCGVGGFAFILRMVKGVVRTSAELG